MPDELTRLPPGRTGLFYCYNVHSILRHSSGRGVVAGTFEE